ncbi:hypothetical protein M9458_017826, partial [Cirrhinus mrigala]
MLGLSGTPGTPCAGSGSPWVPPRGQQSEDLAEESAEGEEREAFNRLKPLSPLEAVPPGGPRTN